ncbi:MAG: DNA translocase FtsK 4TM domain-containing protein [Gammaproteobacteria bacterium]|nr:DNA translocase FtsK 4TM domain-containing protein [Gammaproteobacteria bacterium]
MAQASRKRTPLSPTFGLHVTRGLREGALFVLGALGLYLLLSLFTYSRTDPGWSYASTGHAVTNAGGRAGAWFADVFFSLFGMLAYLFPVMVAYSGWLIYRGRNPAGGFDMRTLALRWVGFLLTLGAGGGLAALRHLEILSERLPQGSGGILGALVSSTLVGVVSDLGAMLFMLALFLTGVTLFTGLSWLGLMDALGRLTLDGLGYLKQLGSGFMDRLHGRLARMEREDVVKQQQRKIEKRPPPRIEPVFERVEPSLRVEKERQVPLFDPPPEAELPPLSLLDAVKVQQQGYSSAALDAMSRQVELKLRDFGIEAQVMEVHPGPVITRFELQPAPGVKVSQISNLAKDLARALSVISLRVVEVIPGKSVVGLEIPNEHRELVYLSEILKSKDYDIAASPLSLALGKDIGGQPVVVDLARMPHLLVAGTTGSGKSVALNAMVLSLLYKTTPREVRLIMIDPKMLELSVYEGVPHLLAPVITDMKEAANALRWCVAEMDRRYRLMAHLGVRNIAGDNRKVREASEQGTPIPHPFYAPEQPGAAPAPAPALQPLPCVVVLVDEFADMMMVVGKKVEELIARLAQKARASGIHLILATQRPSVDVITGLIKANIPTRIAFQVSSRVDSRTILDQMGAEQLLGHGDMLYLPPGSGVPMRIHGAFVADHEVHKVVDHLKRRGGQPEYLEEVLESADANGGTPDSMQEDGEADPLYDQAVRIVTETRRASISAVQRRLKIGYNRAARMIEEMERARIVGPLQSNGMREVLAPPPPAE